MEILSTLDFWQKVDLTSLDLDMSVVKTTDIDGVRYTEMYFTASEFSDGKVRVYCRLAKKLSLQNAPVLIIADELGFDFLSRDITPYLNSGYAVFQFDYCGQKTNSASKFTMYPKSAEFGVYSINTNCIYDIKPDILTSCWYIWSVISFRAIELIKTFDDINSSNICYLGIASGGNFAIKAAALRADHVKSCVLIYDVTIPIAGTDNDTLRTLLSLESLSFAPFVKVPALVLLSSNEDNNSFDKTTALFDKILDPNKRLVIAQNKSHSLSNSQRDTLASWLSNADGINVFPKTPKIEYSVNTDGNINYTIVTDGQHSTQKVEVFFAVESISPAYRYWRGLKCEQLDEYEFIAKAPIYNIDTPVYAFATAFYENFAVSSSPIKLTPKAIGVKAAALTTNRLVYDSEMGLDSWLILSHSALEKGDVNVAVGPYAISGVTSKSCELATFKIGDNRFKGAEGNILQLSLFSINAQNLFFEIKTQDNKVFTASKELLESTNWSKITLSETDFKGIGQLEFKNAISFCVKTAEPIIISNVLWI